MKNFDAINHITGKSTYIDDYTLPEGTLFAEVFDSTIAHGKIKDIKIEYALETEGVVSILTAKDIPGQNQIGGIIKDESLLANNEVKYVGEPIALIVANSVKAAKKAKKIIEISYEKLPAIFDARQAFVEGSLIAPPITFSSGNVENAWKECDVIINGIVDSGGQEHLYLETQGSISIPKEEGCIKIISSTQGPTAVQRQASNVLGLPMNKIEVDVLRLGGAFGGKEDQATVWAVLSALAAYKLNKPVKLVLSRMDDLRMTGKRHPYSSDFKIGLTADGKILAYEATYYQNAGAVADLSTAILERTLFHSTNSYYIPNVKTTGFCCKTNLPPNTAFRGFGGPQGMFVVEAAINKAAEKMGVPVHEIQRKNLLKDGDSFYYGQEVKNSQAIPCWTKAEELFNKTKLEDEINEFNKSNKLKKKGLAFMPICFGISFTSSFLNQASALVHVYTDGSVSISTAAVEMGQGVNVKILKAAAKTFSVDEERIKIETTNTTRIANTSPTAASSGADMNGNATIIACSNILDRLKLFAAKELEISDPKHIIIKDEIVYVENQPTQFTWETLIQSAYFNRINLSSHAYYATPKIYFDRKINQGNPFAYHVYGTSITTIILDCLRGTYEIESVKVVHDFGESLDKNIDLGQAEGAIVQGIGWLTTEEVKHSVDGKLLSNTLSTYKIPDIYSVPKILDVQFLENSTNKFGPFNSKAIGEPPFMYAIGSYFAILNAMKAFQPEKEFIISAPITPEKVLLEIFK